MPKFFKMLDLSTAHLTESLARELNSFPGVIANDREYGWLLWVPENIDEHVAEYESDEPMTPPDDPNYADVHQAEAQERDLNEIPSEIVTIWRYAEKHDCQYVLLDRDAEKNPDLPTYDW
jgi:hypothetical protein